jgi:hypothetical protein
VYTNFKAVHREVTDLCREIIIAEAKNKDSYVFYHGHGNNLRLYMDLLRQIKSYENVQDLDDTNPLRDKSENDPIQTADELLQKYEDAAQQFAQKNNLNLYDNKRALGVGFAPDKIELFRDHAISTNINLFGNMNCLAECTLFYFLDSFNISDPNEALLKNILKRILPENTSEEVLQEKVNKYKDLYKETMAKTGGNLMQIFVKKDAVDELGFASWMKGIPVWLDKNTQKIATRNNSNHKAVPVLTDLHKEYDRPSMSSYVDLYRNNIRAFGDKYSNFSLYKKRPSASQKLHSIDRAQARLVVNPMLFTDRDKVKINQYTRFPAKKTLERSYKDGLKKLVAEDVNQYLADLKGGKIEGAKDSKLKKLNQLIYQTPFTEQSTPLSLVA